MLPGPPARDPRSAEELKKLVAKRVLGAGVFATDDIHADDAAMTARDVALLQAPQERPYGTEAVFRDDSGDWFSFTRRRAGPDLGKDWGFC